MEWFRRRDIVRFRTRLFLLGFVVVLLAGSLVFAPKTGATLAVFYPATCQGDWQNPDNAAGAPSLPDQSPASLFTSDNSAVLNDSHGSLTCGNFQGTVPGGSTPKTFDVKIGWSFDDGSIVHDGTVQDAAATSTPTDASATSTPSSDDTSSSTQVSADNSSAATSTPADDSSGQTASPTPTVDDSSAPASDTSTETVVPVPDDSSASSTPDSTDSSSITATSTGASSASASSTQITDSSSDPTSSDTTVTDTGDDSSETASSSTPDDASASSTIASSIAALVDGALQAGENTGPMANTAAGDTNDVLEVRYTIDGTNWVSLGTVNGGNWQSASFQIDDPGVGTWSDISKLQIGLFSLDTTATDPQPAVYVDSMEIDVDYDPPQQADLPTVKLDDSAIGILTPSKDNFTLDDSPTFTVVDPSLSADELADLVSDKQATVISDPYGVLSAASLPAAPSSDASVLAPSNSPDISAPTDTDTSTPSSADTSSSTQISSDDSSAASSTSTADDSSDASASSTPPSAAPDASAAPTDDSSVSPAPSPVDSVASSALGAFAGGASSAYHPSAKAPAGHARRQFLLSFIKLKGDIASVFPLTSLPRSLLAFVGGAPPTISAVVLDSLGNQTTIATNVEQVVVDGQEEDQVVVEKPDNMFRPGEYTLQVTLQTADAIIISDQDFSWGVLAINVDRSIYQPDTTAYVQMGVIDDTGSTICDADMTLTVTDPYGSVQTFATAGGSIVQNPACGPNNFISTPDYYAHVPVGAAPGTYTMTLTANTYDGTRTVNDSFQVDPSVAFDVERTGPTRIYPADPYPVTMTITSPTAWTGTVVEEMPSVFTPTLLDGVVPYDTVTATGTDTFISWDLSLAAGTPTTIGYQFLAPPISPEFYLLGPLSFYNSGDDPTTATPVFQEARRWQIADDSACVSNLSGGTGNWNSAATWTSCGGTFPQAGDTVTVSSGDTVTLNVDTNALAGITINGTLDASNATACGSGSRSCNLSASTLTVGSAGTYKAGTGSTITLNATSGTLLTMNSGGTFNAGTSTITSTGIGALTINGGTGTFTGSNQLYNLTVTSSGGFVVKSLGANIQLGGTLTQTGNCGFDTSSTSNYSLTAAQLAIGTGTGAFNLNASTVTLTGSGTLITALNANDLGAGTSTIIVNPDNNATVMTLAYAQTLYNVQFSPATLSANRTYTLGSGALTTISGNLTIHPTATSANSLTVALGSAVTVAAAKTTLIQGTSATTGLAILSNSTSGYAFSTGFLNLQDGGTFLGDPTAAANVTVSGASGAILTRSANGTFTAGNTTVLTSGGGTKVFTSGAFTGNSALNNLNISGCGAENELGAAMAITGTISFCGVMDAEGYPMSIGYFSVPGAGSDNFRGDTSVITFTGTSGTLITQAAAAFTAGTSTIVVASDANVTVFSGAITVNNLEFDPVLSANRTYTMGTMPTISGNFKMNPSGSANTLTYTLPANFATIGATKSITIESTGGSATALFDTSSSNFTVSAGAIDVESGGSFSMRASAITVSGALSSGALFTNNGTITPGTSTLTFSGAATSGAFSFAGSNLNASTSGTTNFLSAVTVNNASFAAPLDAPVAMSGALTITSGTLNTSTANCSSTSCNFSAGTVSLAGTLTANSATITLTGSSGTIFSGSGTFTAGTSTLAYTGLGAITLFGAAKTINNLTFSPALAGSSIAYTIGTAPTINGNFTMDPSGTANTLTLTLAATFPTIGATKTILIESAGGSATALFDTSSSNFAVSSGAIDIESGGSFNMRNSTVTITGALTSGTLFTNNGTLTPGSSAIAFTGAATSGARITGGANLAGAVSGTTNHFNNVTINNASFAAPLGTNTTIAGTLTITNGIVDTNSTSNYTLSFGNVFATTGSGSKLLGNASTIYETGVSGALMQFNLGSVWTMGTSNVTVTSASGTPQINQNAMTFYNVTIDAPTATGITENAAITIAAGGKFYVQAGVYTDAGIPITGSSTSIFQIDSGAKYQAEGTFPTGFTGANIAFNVNSTFEYASGGFTVSTTPTYGNILFSYLGGAGVDTFATGTATIAGNLTIDPTTGSSADTVTLVGTTTVGGTTLITRTGSSTATLKTNLSGTLTTGNIDIEAGGTLNGNTAPTVITVAGNWTNNGTLSNLASSTVLFNTGTKSVISGSGTNTFNILQINPGAGVSKEVDFTAGNTFTASTFTVTGHGGNLVKLFSTSPGTTWTLVPGVTANNSVTFADVEDSSCSSASNTTVINATSSTNDGNNSLTTSGCWSFSKPYLNFTLSTNTVDFGGLPLSASRYATPGVSSGGASSEPATSAADQVTVATSGSGGYNLFIEGNSLSGGGIFHTIAPIGCTNTSPASFTSASDEFGIRVEKISGAGSVAGGPLATPATNCDYGGTGSGYAYNATATTPDVIGSYNGSAIGTTTYAVQYVTYAVPSTPEGNYSTNLTFVTVGNF